jgi:hypothetical protein
MARKQQLTIVRNWPQVNDDADELHVLWPGVGFARAAAIAPSQRGRLLPKIACNGEGQKTALGMVDDGRCHSGWGRLPVNESHGLPSAFVNGRIDSSLLGTGCRA